MSIIIPFKNKVFRYDKLYMGNDVFFYNEKTGRVERLQSTLDGSNSYNRYLKINYDT